MRLPAFALPTCNQFLRPITGPRIVCSNVVVDLRLGMIQICVEVRALIASVGEPLAQWALGQCHRPEVDHQFPEFVQKRARTLRSQCVSADVIQALLTGLAFDTVEALNELQPRAGLLGRGFQRALDVAPSMGPTTNPGQS